MASTPTRWPCSRIAATNAAMVVDLPTPGGPVSPRIIARPVVGASAFMSAGSSGAAFSIRLIERPTARGFPSRTAASSELRF